jgi:TrmH family RNA methyltransferase
MKIINSASNYKIKELKLLRKAPRQRAADLFIIDGRREIALAQEAGWEIEAVFYCPALAKDKPTWLEKSASDITEVSPAVFEKICYKENPAGLLAVARRQEWALAELALGVKPLVVILEAVEKPGNIGAVIRTAYAAGVTAVIIADSQTDLFNPNVIRASEGLIFKQPLGVASSAAVLAWLKSNKIEIFAAATDGAKSYSDVDLSGPVALVFGTEATGLRSDWLQAAAEKIKIPMRPDVDSLNVSVSAAIVTYEAVRQRSLKRANGSKFR